jgi:hypothetical protein
MAFATLAARWSGKQAQCRAVTVRSKGGFAVSTRSIRYSSSPIGGWIVSAHEDIFESKTRLVRP